MISKNVPPEVIERLASISMLAGAIELAYLKIKRDPEFEKQFHTLDIDLQRLVVNMLNRAAKLDTVKTVTLFMHRNNYDEGTLLRWSNIDKTNESRLYNGPRGKPSAELVIKVKEFTEALKSYDLENKTYDSHAYMMGFMFFMRTVHGEDHVMKMLDHWMLNLENFSYSRFEKFAESWDGVKDLPLEWALKITGAE